MLKFIKYTAPNTQLTRCMVSELMSYNLAGDWLNPAPTLQTCSWYMQSLVAAAAKNVKYKYHNEIKVIQEPNSVYLQVIGVKTDIKTKLCGFENQQL